MMKKIISNLAFVLGIAILFTGIFYYLWVDNNKLEVGVRMILSGFSFLAFYAYFSESKPERDPDDVARQSWERGDDTCSDDEDDEPFTP